ncbi:MAG: hypothetical protein ACKOA1_02860, partial [Bacteroidota bacterium]
YYIGSGLMQPVLLNQGEATAIGTETDTLIIELRESLDPDNNILETKTALLMTDGSASVHFDSVATGVSCWIVLNHRMSIETWSTEPVLMYATTSYDFSNDAAQTFGGNQIEMEPGVFAVYSGDLNQDGFIDTFDNPILEADNFNFAQGYVSSDLNGDGFVDTFDSPVLEQNNFNFVMFIRP